MKKVKKKFLIFTIITANKEIIAKQRNQGFQPSSVGSLLSQRKEMRLYAIEERYENVSVGG